MEHPLLLIFSDHISVVKSLKQNSIFLPKQYHNITTYEQNGYIIPYSITTVLPKVVVIDTQGAKHEGQLIQINDNSVYLKINEQKEEVVKYISYQIIQPNIIGLTAPNLAMASYESNVDATFSIKITLTNNHQANLANLVTVTLSEDNITADTKTYNVFTNPNILSNVSYRSRSVSMLAMASSPMVSNESNEDNIANLTNVGIRDIVMGEQALIIKQYDIEYGKYHVLLNHKDNIFLYFRNVPLPYRNIEVYNKNLLLLAKGSIIRQENISTINSGPNNSTAVNFVDKTTSSYNEKTQLYTYNIDVTVVEIFDNEDIYYAVSNIQGIVTESKPAPIIMMAGYYMLKLDNTNNYHIKQTVTISL